MRWRSVPQLEGNHLQKVLSACTAESALLEFWPALLGNGVGRLLIVFEAADY